MRVVIPSVDYADMLAVTLPAWLAFTAPTEITIVSRQDDAATAAVAARAGVTWWPSHAWRSDGAVFNKAAALDEAFGFCGPRRAPPPVGTLCLAADADAFPIGHLPPICAPGVLYSCARYTCETPAELVAARTAPAGPPDLPRRNGGDRGAGYFQLFAYRPGLTYGSFPNAGDYDLAFHRHFDQIVGLADFHILHLGRTSSRNWRGRRILPRWTSA